MVVEGRGFSTVGTANRSSPPVSSVEVPEYLQENLHGSVLLDRRFTHTYTGTHKDLRDVRPEATLQTGLTGVTGHVTSHQDVIARPQQPDSSSPCPCVSLQALGREHHRNPIVSPRSSSSLIPHLPHQPRLTSWWNYGCIY